MPPEHPADKAQDTPKDPPQDTVAHVPRSRITRAKTKPGRLEPLDRFLTDVLANSIRCCRPPGCLVDLGFGYLPWTTAELYEHVCRLWDDIHIIGVDTDPARVAKGQSYAKPGLSIRTGGFSLPLRTGETVHVIRAMNVLRQYRHAEADAARRALGAQLADGGFLICGASETSGHILTASVDQRVGSELVRVGLLFHTSGAHGFGPAMFRHWLPRQYTCRLTADHPLKSLFDDWVAAFDGRRADREHPNSNTDATSNGDSNRKARVARDVFLASARRLSNDDFILDEDAFKCGHVFLKTKTRPARPARPK